MLVEQKTMPLREHIRLPVALEPVVTINDGTAAADNGEVFEPNDQVVADDGVIGIHVEPDNTRSGTGTFTSDEVNV